MSQELPPQYDAKSVEARIYKEWMDRGFFAPSKRSTLNPKRSYTILLPPPNITGNLHMGHALNATISDILIRYHRMKGFATAWLPGIDHAGIAAQNVVEKNLRKENINRFDLGREKFVEKVWEWKEKYGNIILDQLKRIGASCDWSRTRFTMDPAYSEEVTKAFVHYYEKGLIYRGKRVVNWCPRCQTSLSDLEIEYKEEDATLYYIQYGSFVLATVRPETKFGDTAIAVHPKDPRYKKYIGKELEIESLDTTGALDAPRKTKTKIVVVADDAVDPKFGTGTIKVTPAHDMTDYDISLRHNLPMIQIIDERGRMNERAGKYAGMKVAEARKKVVEDLRAVGLLTKEEPYHHSVAVCYRCTTPLEPLPSNQWFLNMAELAKKTAQAIKSKKTRIIPKNFEKSFFAWLKNIKDWCISRQIWWGHRLPVWFCANSHDGIEQKIKELLPRSNQNLGEPPHKNISFVVSLEKPERCRFCLNCKMDQSTDVLDTWFSSALWPFAGLNDADKKQFYPSNVLITARDIINLWVGRMIFSGIEFMSKTPFPDVLIHGTILTKDGKRMSKSLGTGIDPLQYIDQYGADAMRFGIIWQTMGNQDIRWDEAAIMAGRKFANKIWNAARFVFGRIGNASTSLPTGQAGSANNYSLSRAAAKSKGYLDTLKPKTGADKQVLKKLTATKKMLEKQIASYELGPALHTLYDFFWHDFCDVYLEASKTQPDENTNALLLNILTASLKMLHPFMPHITEEIFQKLPTSEGKWLIVEEW